MSRRLEHLCKITDPCCRCGEVATYVLNHTWLCERCFWEAADLAKENEGETSHD